MLQPNAAMMIIESYTWMSEWTVMMPSLFNNESNRMLIAEGATKIYLDDEEEKVQSVGEHHDSFVPPWPLNDSGNPGAASRRRNPEVVCTYCLPLHTGMVENGTLVF